MEAELRWKTAGDFSGVGTALSAVGGFAVNDSSGIYKVYARACFVGGILCLRKYEFVGAALGRS